MTTSPNETYRKLCQAVQEATMIGRIQHLLEWDEHTKMPKAGGAYRADQTAYLAGLVHQKQTAPEIGDWLAELAESDLVADPKVIWARTCITSNVTMRRRPSYRRRLVEQLTRACTVGQQVWIEARQADDFKRFQPNLEEIFRLKREEAGALGYDSSPYDPLLDEYEPGETTENVARVLSELRDALVPLVQAIADSDQRPEVSILARSYPVDVQESFGTQVAKQLGFDFEAGRLDVTAHPFCTGLGPGDVRITTRYDEHAFSDAFFSILHEAGHGMYDQGLPREHYGLPIGEDVSLGIHESQSRMWENQVGRSRAFWDHFYSAAQEAFPQALGDVELTKFYDAINDVRPSLIRVEADEVTYNLHILIRFELEQALIEDQLQVADLPSAWNEKYEHYLGITPPNNADGVLQDVHWSAGLIGYFPTYALGNLYAAQFFDQAKQDIAGLEDQFRTGEFSSLLSWLRENIHQHGRRYSPAELVERVTGGPLQHDALISQLQKKYGEIYGL